MKNKNKKTKMEAVNKYLIFLRKKGINVQKAILFGSVAKGKDKKNSDIDIAIISKDFEKDPFKAQVKLLKYAAKVDARIEPIALTNKEFDEVKYPLVFEIKKNGKRIF